MDRDLFDELGRVEARLHQLPGREAAVPETRTHAVRGLQREWKEADHMDEADVRIIYLKQAGLAPHLSSPTGMPCLASFLA